MEIKNKKLIKSVGGLTAGLMLLGLTNAGCVPKRATLYEANNFAGTVAEYSTDYAKRETTLDAAETNREARCLTDLMGRTFASEQMAYSALNQCVDSTRTKDYAKYLTFATFADGLKAYVFLNGLFGSADGGVLRSSGDTTTETLSGISNSGSGGDMLR
jgi:hypothetical protein